MAELELALAASTRGWSDRLHGFLTNHGGARVRVVVMSAADTIGESYDLLIIDDVCSFLTPRLVSEVERLGRVVVGVFDSNDGTDAKRRLLDCGIDNMVGAAAPPEEFLEVIANLNRVAPGPAQTQPSSSRPGSGGRIIVVGAPAGGCGATEVALAMTAHLGAILIDADDVVPSVAQRVAGPVHPNLRTAVDVVHHRSGDLDDVITFGGGVRIIAGLVGSEDWAQVHPGEIEAVVAEVARLEANVVVNVSAGLERPQTGEGRFGLARAMVPMADDVVAVGLANPVSVTRLVRWVEEARTLNPLANIHLAVNRVSRSSYRRSELATELTRLSPGLEPRFLPDDPRVIEAAWEGTGVRKGPFTRAVARLSTGVLS